LRAGQPVRIFAILPHNNFWPTFTRKENELSKTNKRTHNYQWFQGQWFIIALHSFSIQGKIQHQNSRLYNITVTDHFLPFQNYYIQQQHISLHTYNITVTKQKIELYNTIYITPSSRKNIIVSVRSEWNTIRTKWDDDDKNAENKNERGMVHNRFQILTSS